MILVLAALFAEAHDLRRARLARDIESGHLYACGRAGLIDYGPHAVDYYFVLISGNRKNLGLRAIEGSRRTRSPIVGARWIVADRGDGAHLFQEMGDKH